MEKKLLKKRVIISSSISRRVARFLETYKDENLRFEYIGNETLLNAVLNVYTNETDNERLTIRINKLVMETPVGKKGIPVGPVLYFMVTVE